MKEWGIWLVGAGVILLIVAGCQFAQLKSEQDAEYRVCDSQQVPREQCHKWFEQHKYDRLVITDESHRY